MNVQSIKDKLRNEAIASNKTIQDIYTYYGREKLKKLLKEEELLGEIRFEEKY